MTARTAYGLDTPRGTRWEEFAACRPGQPVDPEWWWPEAGTTGPEARRAIHICRAHCPVRVQCRRDAAEHPPTHPCVQGGRRYVAKSGGGGRVIPSGVVERTSAVGCPYCAGES